MSKSNNNNQSKNNHEMEKAGYEIGQSFNVSEYDSEYKGKKGMKFLFWMIIAVTVFCIVFLLIKGLM